MTRRFIKRFRIQTALSGNRFASVSSISGATAVRLGCRNPTRLFTNPYEEVVAENGSTATGQSKRDDPAWSTIGRESFDRPAAHHLFVVSFGISRAFGASLFNFRRRANRGQWW